MVVGVRSLGDMGASVRIENLRDGAELVIRTRQAYEGGMELLATTVTVCIRGLKMINPHDCNLLLDMQRSSPMSHAGDPCKKHSLDKFHGGEDKQINLLSKSCNSITHL